MEAKHVNVLLVCQIPRSSAKPRYALLKSSGQILQISLRLSPTSPADGPACRFGRALPGCSVPQTYAGKAEPRSLELALAPFCTAATDPSAFNTPSTAVADLAKKAAKAVYESLLTSAGPSEQLQAELYVEGFDAEQIWSQLDASNSITFRWLKKRLKNLPENFNLLNVEAEGLLDELEQEGGKDSISAEGLEEASPSHSSEISQEDADGGISSDDGAAELGTSSVSEDDLRGSDGEEMEPSGLEDDGPASPGRERLPVEDQFLQLDDMERFVQDAEEAALRADAGGGEEPQALPNEDAEEPVPDEDSDDLGGELEFDSDGSGRGIMYEDFFTRSAPAKPDKLVKPGEPQREAELSAHERRMQRMAERAARLEQENLAEKDWQMRGEVGAAARPLNSALEVDLDFDRSLQPPPQPTEEVTVGLEELIKRRITGHQFDDPARRAAPSDKLQRELIELDDKKAAKGLGEVYEEEYVRAKTGNVLEDRHEKPRAEAKLILKELFAKLDALSHFHFAPKPIIQDTSIRKEVPALAMEDVAPQIVSQAARLKPEEVYQPPKQEAGALTHTDRRKQRAANKRSYKKQQARQETERKSKPTQAHTASNVIGRKSASQETVARLAGEKAKKKRARPAKDDKSRINYSKSAAVFGKIQDERGAKRSKASQPNLKSSNLKL